MTESLPPELLLEIINYVRNKENISNLCLVSRRFNDLASPFLLSRISLGGFTSRFRKKSTQLTTLSKGGTKASTLATHLSIDYSSSFTSVRFTRLELTMFKYLKSAMASFKTIITISWKLGRYEPIWLKKSMLSYIFAIPTLKGVHLRYWSDPYEFVILELGRFLGQGSVLTDLDISPDGYPNNSPLFQFINQAEKPPSLQCLSMNNDVSISSADFKPIVQNFRSLQSLYIYASTSCWSGYSIWHVLVTERIYIRTLSTDILNTSLLRYLSSFQGLRSFVLIVKFYRFSSVGGMQPVDILRAMIPHHAESLAELNILVDNDHHIDDWSPPFSENLVSLLSSFNNLRYFAPHLLTAPNYGPVVKYYLSTCAKIFSKLERLILHTPAVTFYIRNPQVPFHLPFTFNIHEAITECQCNDSSFEIDCEKLIYKPHKDEIAGTSSYVRVA